MKAVGITGPPGAGKTSVWRAVTGGVAKGDTAAVAVPDPRLDTLSRMHGSRKTVPVQVEFIDVHASARTPAAATARLREMDCVLVVVPAFGGLDGAPALGEVVDDLVLADTAPIEHRLERARKDAAARGEVPVLEEALALLNSGRRLAEKEWEPDAFSVFSSIAPITLEPIVVVFNVDEEAVSEPPPETRFRSLAVCARLEAEVAGMDAEEAAGLLGGYGIAEPVGPRLIREVLAAFDLVVFFTSTDKETRGWDVPSRTRAVDAAGVIHSDMQRGFIRAEVARFEEVESAGSWEAAKGAGAVRTEGKEYLVADGDVVWFRFSV